jgi:hypothetical protein
MRVDFPYRGRRFSRRTSPLPINLTDCCAFWSKLTNIAGKSIVLMIFSNPNLKSCYAYIFLVLPTFRVGLFAVCLDE